ncbi:MAG: hypothetical protein PHQ04_03400 [Opitutaceae bacterium]|nr:hypothetical protein [Opitutaceae bacterium]
MFSRIIYEDWQLIFPIVALLVAATIFATASWRTLRMKKTQVDHLARLPLDED